MKFRMIAAGLALITSVAVAQDTGKGGAVDEVVDVTVATPAQLRKLADEALPIVKDNAKAVKKLTADAQSKGSDADLLSCLVPKATSIAALVNVVTDSRAAIIANLDKGNEKGVSVARTHSHLVAVSVNKSNSIRQAAEGCDARSTFSDRNSRSQWTGGIGDDQDTIDNDQLQDIDVGFDPPPVTAFGPTP